MKIITNQRANEVLRCDIDVINKVTALVDKIKPSQDVLNKALAKRDDYASTLLVENGKFINYGNCYASECDEIRNSTPWKHWKFSDKVDLENLNIEITDIFHFGPSISLVLDAHNSKIHPVDDVLSQLEMSINAYHGITRESDVSLSDAINLLNTLVACVVANISCMFYERKYHEEFDLESLMSLYADNMSIMIVAVYIHQLAHDTTIDESIDMIYKTYVVKNTLNKFRNDNGYNDGSYVKLWRDGLEDNVIAMEIAKNFPNITPDVLYTELTKAYAEVVK